MILTKAGATVAFVPPWLRDQPNPPTFDLVVGSLTDRDLFEARLDGEFDAARVYDFHLRAAAIDGARALGGDDADALVALISAGFGDEALPDDERATFIEAEKLIRQHWPEYRELVLQNARRQKLQPTLAFLTWCTGWRNVTDVQGQPIEFARDATGAISEAAMRRIPDLLVAVVGAQALAMQYGRGEEKNSSPPSPSDGTRGNSGSVADGATDGSSAAKRGKKTRR